MSISSCLVYFEGKDLFKVIDFLVCDRVNLEQINGRVGIVDDEGSVNYLDKKSTDDKLKVSQSVGVRFICDSTYFYVNMELKNQDILVYISFDSLSERQTEYIIQMLDKGLHKNLSIRSLLVVLDETSWEFYNWDDILVGGGAIDFDYIEMFSSRILNHKYQLVNSNNLAFIIYKDSFTLKPCCCR